MKVIARDYVAWFIWIFSLIYTIFVGLGIYVLVKHGLPPEDSPLKVTLFMSAFVAAIGLLAWQSFTRHTTEVTQLSSKRIRVVVCYPHRRYVREFHLKDIQPAWVIESTDSEGDPYFYTRLNLGYPFPQPVNIAQGTKAHCVHVCENFNRLRA